MGHANLVGPNHLNCPPAGLLEFHLTDCQISLVAFKPQIRVVLFLFGCSPGLLVSFRVRIGFAQEGNLGLAGMATAVYCVKSIWPNLAPLANPNYNSIRHAIAGPFTPVPHTRHTSILSLS
jgi:hypothetical protein